VTYINPWCLY